MRGARRWWCWRGCVRCVRCVRCKLHSLFVAFVVRCVRCSFVRRSFSRTVAFFFVEDCDLMPNIDLDYSKMERERGPSFFGVDLNFLSNWRLNMNLLLRRNDDLIVKNISNSKLNLIYIINRF